MYGDEFDSNFVFNPDKLIRSKKNCRVGLIRWGDEEVSNKNRPYYEENESEG